MADSEVVCLSSDSEADVTIQNEFSQGKKRSFHCSFHCTVCGTEMFGISEIHEHPTLHGVGICSDCFDVVLNCPFTKDPVDGADNECTWCGQGGTIIICYKCEKVFCEDCIVRNYGRKRGLTPILRNINWSCFCCNPQPLWVQVNKLKEFRNFVSSKRNFSPRPKDARTSKTRHASQNARDVNRGNQCRMLAELLTQNKEQNQGEGIQTKSRNIESRKPSIQKRVEFPCTKQRHPPEAKQHEGIEKTQQEAPAVPPARTFTRPHQMMEKRRESAERRKPMAAERLKTGLTNVMETGTQQYDPNLQAKLEIHEADPEPTRIPLLARDYYRSPTWLV